MYLIKLLTCEAFALLGKERDSLINTVLQIKNDHDTTKLSKQVTAQVPVATVARNKNNNTG